MMKTAQLEQALSIARSSATLDVDSIGIFDGFGLPGFGPITCTIEALAMLVRWQCVQFNGGIDSAALNEIATVGRYQFQVINERNGE